MIKSTVVCKPLLPYARDNANGRQVAMAVGMVIIGAGECGAAAALALRAAGYAGPVTVIGAERHSPYERPPLSKAAITAEDEPSPKTIADSDRLAAASITLTTSNRAVNISRLEKTISLADGGSVRYDKLLLATGAIPRRLPKTPPNAVYLRTYDDALRIRSRLKPDCRVAIIGAGFIGLELAASARKRGAKVRVIEAQPRILMRGVPEEIATAVAQRHAAEGVEISCGCGVAAFEESDAGGRLLMMDGGQLEADICIVGIGVAPATDLAEAAGLEIDNGVAVDECLRTSDPHIFAAGDCCSFPLAIMEGVRTRLESWRNAQEQGALAARNMLGANLRHEAVPWFWSDQYDLTLYVAGLANERCKTIRRDLADGAFLLFHLAGDGRLVAASGIGPGHAAAKDIRLAELMIAKRARPAPGELAAPDVKLKALLAA
jgi:3-phenylpropionate/trans-cinnamate dioxygenase ferredoxin reductase component